MTRSIFRYNQKIQFSLKHCYTFPGLRCWKNNATVQTTVSSVDHPHKLIPVIFIHAIQSAKCTLNVVPPKQLITIRHRWFFSSTKKQSEVVDGRLDIHLAAHPFFPSNQFAQLTQRIKQTPEHPRPNVNNRLTYNPLPIQSNPRINTGYLHASSRICDHELLIKTSNWSNLSATAEFSAPAAPFFA